MITRFRAISVFIFLTSYLGYAQTEKVEKSLEIEDPIAAVFYLKSVKISAEHALAESEILILEGSYKKSREILFHNKRLFVTNAELGKYYLLLGILEHKDQRHQESNIAFDQAERFFSNYSVNESLFAQLNYWRGYTLLEQEKLGIAEQKLVAAFQFYKRDSARFYIKTAKIFFWLGTIKYGLAEFDSSIYYLNRSLYIFENIPLDKTKEVIKIYNNLGNSYSDQWNYNEAVSCYKKAIQLNTDKVGDATELAFACSNLGLFYSELENYLQSEHWFNQALDWIQKSTIDPVRRVIILENYGNSLSSRYEFQKALSQYFSALEIANHLKEDRGDVYSQLLLNIATVYLNMGLSSKAEEYKEMASTFLARNNDKWPNEYYACELRSAMLLRYKGLYDESILILDKLQKYYSASNSEVLYNVLLEKAECLRELKQYKESHKLYNQTLKHYDSVFQNSHPQIIYILNDLGFLYAKEMQFDSAIYYLQQAKKYNQLKPSNVYSNDLYASKIEWIISNIALLEIDNKLFSEGKLSIDNLRNSEGLIYSTLSVIESKRIEFRNDLDVTNLYRLVRDFFEASIKYYYILYTHTGDKKYIDKAFSISEKSKYQTLQNSIKLDRVSAFAGVTNKMLSEEQKLEKELAQLEYQYSQELAKQEEPLAELVEEYITQWQINSNRHNELVDSIKNYLPDYYNLKFNRSTVEVSQIQNLVLSQSKDLAWVSYYFGGTDCYAIIITNSSKYFIKLASSEQLTRQIKSLNNCVTHQLDEGMKASSYSLYEGLLNPIDSCLKLTGKIKKIVIVPDGPLNYLNFELLGKPTSKSWHYSLYDYQFSYGYSSTLLWAEFSGQLFWKPEEFRMIGFAPVFNENSTSESTPLRTVSEKPGYDYFRFSPLGKNQYELAEITEILNHKGGQTSIHVGSQADETSFKKANLNSYNIIHLATHSFTSKQDLNIAGIAFAKNESSSDDGILYMDEIFSIKNKAKLVCLSACETGSGVLQQGEGLVGLTRAFIYSGAQNLVVSLWKVQDESTATLMTNFYSSLVKNQSIAGSLHQAKIKMIKKNPKIHPFYWSAFIHIGLN